MTGKLSGELSMTGFLKGARAKVYQQLACVADKHGQSWYSYHSLALRARCSRKTCIEAIKWLERHSLVTVHRGASFTTSSGRRTRGSNLYSLNLEFLEALIKICSIVKKLTLGGSDLKCGAVQRAANWAECLVIRHSWETIVKLANEKPAEIRRIAARPSSSSGLEVREGSS